MLITPHGDLKLNFGFGKGHPLSTHYPSWGFETSRLWYCRTVCWMLITPHGDLKPASLTGEPLTWELITPHGDLKRNNLIVVLQFIVLITPHGDLKPLSDSSKRAIERATHYPSWGFETPIGG